MNRLNLFLLFSLFLTTELFSQNVLTSSNLPILVISTENNDVIPDEPKIRAHMGVIWHEDGSRNNIGDPYDHYNGFIGIEVRGNASQMFPKKPYTMETRTVTGENNNVKLLGLPRENDWILRAGFIDKTLMRDALAYSLGRGTGRWAPRTRHCELVINGEYVGVYTLVERIKPDNDRLDIAKMDADDIAGDSLTGGYIYEISQDGRDFGGRRRFVYPSANDVTPEQADYIRNYVESVHDVMNQTDYTHPQRGYPALIDVDSFIDEILVQEATKNSDTYGWSSFFHKDRLGKLNAGPLWDFDQAMSNSTFNDGPNHEEWIIEKSETETWLRDNYPSFWIQLFREPGFKTRLADRWFELRQGPFRNDRVAFLIDSISSHLAEAQDRNFEKWPILGVELWRSTPGWATRNTYQKEVGYLRSFLIKRLRWMDGQLESDTSVSDPRAQAVGQPGLAVYPNPAAGTNRFEYRLPERGRVTMWITNIRGQRVRELQIGRQEAGAHHVAWDGKNASGQIVSEGLYLGILNLNGRRLAHVKWIRL